MWATQLNLVTSFAMCCGLHSVYIVLIGFSNMPERTCTFMSSGKKKELAFMDSPKMSTYLLAFVIGEFDFLQAQTKNGVAVRVYTPPGRANDGEFSLEVAVQASDQPDKRRAYEYHEINM